MSTRSLRSRLDKLGRPSGEDGPVCRWHGTACQMGRRWPLPFEGHGGDELAEMIEGARRRQGQPATPTRRERWAHQDHEQLPQAELEQDARELAELIAAAEAENERIIADLEAEAEARRVVDEVARRVQDGPS